MDQYINVRAKIIKLFEEDIYVNLCDHRLGSGFLNVTTKARATKGKINLTPSKFKTFVYQRTCQESEKTIHKMGEIFARD